MFIIEFTSQGIRITMVGEYGSEPIPFLSDDSTQRFVFPANYYRKNNTVTFGVQAEKLAMSNSNQGFCSGWYERLTKSPSSEDDVESLLLALRCALDILSVKNISCILVDPKLFDIKPAAALLTRLGHSVLGIISEEMLLDSCCEDGKYLHIHCGSRWFVHAFGKSQTEIKSLGFAKVSLQGNNFENKLIHIDDRIVDGTIDTFRERSELKKQLKCAAEDLCYSFTLHGFEISSSYIANHSDHIDALESGIVKKNLKDVIGMHNPLLNKIQTVMEESNSTYFYEFDGIVITGAWFEHEFAREIIRSICHNGSDRIRLRCQEEYSLLDIGSIRNTVAESLSPDPSFISDSLFQRIKKYSFANIKSFKTSACFQETVKDDRLVEPLIDNFSQNSDPIPTDPIKTNEPPKKATFLSLVQKQAQKMADSVKDNMKKVHGNSKDTIETIKQHISNSKESLQGTLENSKDTVNDFLSNPENQSNPLVNIINKTINHLDENFMSNTVVDSTELEAKISVEEYDQKFKADVVAILGTPRSSYSELRELMVERVQKLKNECTFLYPRYNEILNQMDYLKNGFNGRCLKGLNSTCRGRVQAGTACSCGRTKLFEPDFSCNTISLKIII